MSFWKKLFGGGDSGSGDGGKSAEPATVGEDSYKGYTIKAITMPVGGEFQLAGTIEKVIDGQPRSYKFVRADRFGSREDVASYALAKGRQIIDEQGDTLFGPPPPAQQIH